MPNFPSRIREYVHKNNGSVKLFLGHDDTGRIVSRIEKNGAVIQRDMFVRLPMPHELDKLGWTLAQ